MVGHPDVPAVRSTSVTPPVPGTILAGHRVEARSAAEAWAWSIAPAIAGSAASSR